MPLRMAGQYADEEVGLFYNYFRFYDPATGRYIENDPIDLQGGLNRYGYVGANPLHNIDPKGLVEWNGKVFSATFAPFRLPITLGLGGGIAGDFYILKSPCPDGGESEAKVLTIGGIVSWGVPFSVGFGSASFVDNNNTPNPDVFNGAYYRFSYAVAGGIGTGGSYIEMGDAISPQGSLKPSHFWGWDLSVGFTGGRSVVVDKKECEKCQL